MSDWIEKLERITRLHQAGGLTDEEFAAQKLRILGDQRETTKARNPGPNVVYSPISPIEGPPRSPKIAVFVVAFLLLAGVAGFAAYQSLESSRNKNQAEALARAQAMVDSAQASATASASQSPAPNNSSAATVAPIAVSPSPTVLTYNPSFKCSDRLARAETLICRNRELSEKDRKLSKMFKVILAETDISERSGLLANQRRLLAERSACEDVYCLSEWYDRVIGYYEPYYNDMPPKM